MTDTWQIIAVFFGISTVILLPCLISIAADLRQWRLLALQMRDQGNEVMTCTAALEDRNKWLEIQCQHRNVGNVVLVTQPAKEWIMEVTERSEMP